MSAVPDQARRPRVLVLSPSVPHRHVEHAGGRYLLALDRALDRVAEVAWCVPDVPTNREAVTRPGRPDRVYLRGRARTRRFRDRFTVLLLERLWRSLQRFDATLPPFVFLYGAVSDPETRALIREADVIDLQWSEYVRLAPVLRRLNPDARLVGTFHDVLSQRWSRYAAVWEPGFQRVVWRFSAALARRSERAALRRFDDLVVFSDKDRGLLRAGPGSSVHVVPPPLYDAGSAAPPHAPDGRAGVVFVGFWQRWENNDAALWLVRELWPAVLAQVPHAHLRLVGAKAGEELSAAVAAAERVELTGFVDDLAEEYRTADVAVVPLRLGAGVKFKTIESLLAGVPTVTTPVGCEGVGADDLFVRVSERGADLVAGIVEVLRDPGPAQQRAQQARRTVEQTFGVDAFERRVAAMYRPRDGVSPADRAQ